MKVHKDQGLDRDLKYSRFRRYFPFKCGYRNLYCTDLDWIEWRKGKQVAVVEVTRTLGKPVDEVLSNFINRNNGFQKEVLVTVADELDVPAYVTIISDPNQHEDPDYNDADFYVYRLIKLPDSDHWEPDRECGVSIKGIYYGGEDYLKNFLSKL